MSTSTSRTRAIAAAVVLLALPAGVQAQLTPPRQQLMVASRFVELEQLAEKEAREDPSEPSYRLFYRCAAYSKLKRYNKLFPCLDKLEANVRRGDVAMTSVAEMQKNSPFMAGLALAGAAMVGGRKGLEGTVAPMIPVMRAEAWTELREYDRAMAAAREALALVPEQWNMERFFRIQALGVLGLSHALGGRPEEARKYADDLGKLSTSYPYTALTKDKVSALARVYLALGDFKKAYEAFRSDSVGLGGALLALGDALGGAMAGMAGESMFTYQEIPNSFMRIKTAFEVGEVKEAKEGYDRLLALPRFKDNGEIYWVALYDRGRIAASEGDLKAAAEYWRQAVEVIEQQRSTINTEANKIGFVGDKQAVYRRLIEALFRSGDHAAAFDYLERSKSRALVDMLAGKRDFAVAAADENKVRELLAKADESELEARAQVVGTGQAGGQRTLVVEPTRTALAQSAPELASLVSVTSTPIAEIQSRIGEDEALVQYYYDEKSLYAFVLTREGLQGLALELGALEDEVRALREALEDEKSDRWRAPAQALHARLVKPLAAALGGRTRLIVVAHGALHYLPFAALHDGNEYLLDRHALRFLPSASVVKYLRGTRVQKPGGILAFGNPDLGDPRLDLRFAQEEALAVAGMVPQSRALVRREATETALREYAAGFTYLHFATHGEFKAEAPLESALLLSKDERSDGLLTVGKLYSMRLDSDLVTLSACETGLGKVASGDDVVGLTRGFLYAGASSIVASLWKVDDQATAELMNAFYRGLAEKDKRQALREAQLAARQKFPHPYYWAAFQLTGNAR